MDSKKLVRKNKKSKKKIILNILLAVIMLFSLFKSTVFIKKHFLSKNTKSQMMKKYGEKGYVLITAASSGQGKCFAIHMAKLGFNLILVGSIRTENTKKTINELYPNCDIIFIQKNFMDATQPDFFNEIEEAIKSPKVNGNLSGLINNVGYRTAWNPYHKMPKKFINDTIIVGTIVQSQLSRIALLFFVKRNEKSFLINITAQCIIPTWGLGSFNEPQVTVPYLSVYEAANAFGFYQGNSLHKEYQYSKYKDKIDIMNVMPGAVLTENTKYLSKTLFAVKDIKFAKNVINQIGHYNGNIYGYWGHEFSIFLINIVPFIKNKILKDIGKNISTHFMKTPIKKY